MKVIDVGKDFSRYPAGRFIADGPYPGELFRERYLAPALQSGETLKIVLDNTAGYGSSFLEEAFGGLAREHGLAPDFIEAHLVLETSDDLLRQEILGYIRPTT